MKRCLSILLIIVFFCPYVMAQKKGARIVVDAAGNGNFKTIQEALNSLPDSTTTDREIFIKKGIYNEKIFIVKNHVVLRGEDEKGTILTQDIARDLWRCQDYANDWGVATLNLQGSDITLRNMTIVNGYAMHYPKDTLIYCRLNGKSTPKTIGINSHQMALRSFQTTRLKVLNCTLTAWGGDTVSPWNGDAGLFYFKGCTMEGGVDFYCPRGWAYAEDCTFICRSRDAAIWHDGSKNISQKTVLVNCRFSGFDGFKLGRYHKDSQFYLIGCTFAANMADAPIYRAVTSPGIQWGERIYFYNCHRKGGDYAWFKDNLATAAGAPAVSAITAQWAFDNQWKSFSN